MRANQVVAGMVDEILRRQGVARAQCTGESFEDALSAVLGTEAGRQLQELRDGPHRLERVDDWQASLARQRTKERDDRLRGHLPNGKQKGRSLDKGSSPVMGCAKGKASLGR
jgi:hypothetical protein